MIKVVSCGCYFDLMLQMKNVSLQIFYGGVSGCINLIHEITSMRERLKRSCTDFVSIDNDSIIFVCFNCLKDQIFITDQNYFLKLLLKSKTIVDNLCQHVKLYEIFNNIWVKIYNNN